MVPMALTTAGQVYRPSPSRKASLQKAAGEVILRGPGTLKLGCFPSFLLNRGHTVSLILALGSEPIVWEGLSST